MSDAPVQTRRVNKNGALRKAVAAQAARSSLRLPPTMVNAMRKRWRREDVKAGRVKPGGSG